MPVIEMTHSNRESSFGKGAPPYLQDYASIVGRTRDQDVGDAGRSLTDPVCTVWTSLDS